MRCSGLLTDDDQAAGDAHTAIRTPDGRLYGGVRPGTTLPSEELEAELRPYIESTALKGITSRRMRTTGSGTPTCRAGSAISG